jgi:hypothetical protein
LAITLACTIELAYPGKGFIFNLEPGMNKVRIRGIANLQRIRNTRGKGACAVESHQAIVGPLVTTAKAD